MKKLVNLFSLCAILLCILLLAGTWNTTSVYANTQNTALFQVQYKSSGYALDGSYVVVSLLDENGEVEAVLGETNRGEVEVPIDAVTHAGKSVRVDMTLCEEFQFAEDGGTEKSVIYAIDELATGEQYIQGWVAYETNVPNLSANLPEIWCYVGKPLDLSGAYNPYNGTEFQISYNWNPVVCEYAYITRAETLEETETRGVYEVLAEGTFYINFYYQGEYAQVKVNAQPLEDNSYKTSVLYGEVPVDGAEITYILKDSREAETGTVLASSDTGELVYHFTVADHSGKYVQVDISLPESYYMKDAWGRPSENYVSHMMGNYDIDSILGAGYTTVENTIETTDVRRDGMLSVNLEEIPVIPVGISDIFTGAFNTDLDAKFQVYYTAPDGTTSRVECDSFVCSGGSVNAYDDAGRIEVTAAVEHAKVWFYYGNLVYVADVNTSYPVTALTLDKTVLTMEVGESVQLTPVPTLITDVDVAYNWMSLRTDIATVDQNGNVTAVAPGKSTIRVQALDGSYKVALCEVTVVEAGSGTPGEGGSTPGEGGNSGGVTGGITPEQVAQIRSFVERMYTIVLNRVADPAGLDDWAEGLIEQRVDGAEVVSGFVNSPEFAARGLSDEDYIKTLYLAILNREADEAGLNDWLRAFSLGQTRQDLLNGFVGSAEFDALCDGYGIFAIMTQEDMVRSFASRMYTVALNRAADEAGLAYWVSKLMSGQADGAAIADGFINSAEFVARNLNDTDYIKTLYLTFLNREADEAGLNSWLGAFAQGYSRPDVLNAFIGTEEFGALCREFGISAKLTQRDRVSNFVSRMYTVALNREADEAGLNDWVTGLINGVIKGAEVAEGFIMSAEFEARNLTNEEYVKTLYRTFFNREASVDDVNGWVSAMVLYGQSRREVLKGFVNSGEFGTLCENYGIIRGEMQ